MPDDFAVLDGTVAQCPGCGGALTRTDNGRTVELLHARPICAEFEAFVSRLIERNDQAKADERRRGS